MHSVYEIKPDNRQQGGTLKARLLVVDDEASILHALQIFLEQEGYQVQSASQYEDLLKEAKPADLPDLVILDVVLEEEDGRAIAKQLKQNPKTRAIPIILISAHPSAVKDIKTDPSGADAFLAKPFDADVLLDTIDQLLSAKAVK